MLKCFYVCLVVIISYLLIPDVNKDAVMMDTTGYRAVGFSYGNPDESTEQKDNDTESIFHPPFPVPESLIQNLVSTYPYILYLLFANSYDMGDLVCLVLNHCGQMKIV